jgi:integrase
VVGCGTSTKSSEEEELAQALELTMPSSRRSISHGVSTKSEKQLSLESGSAHLVALNQVARSVIDEARGQHPDLIFTCRDRSVLKINNSPLEVRTRSRSGSTGSGYGLAVTWGFRHARVHDLKHTFGQRLRAAGVSFEDRQDLLGHRTARITAHYSQAELENLLAAAEQVCAQGSRKSPALVLLRKQSAGS